MGMGQICASVDEIVAITKPLRQEGKVLVAVNGCFDAYHEGHNYFLSQARTHGDILVALLNTDEYIRRRKGQERPLRKATQRLIDVAFFGGVDYACLFEEGALIAAYKRLRPDVYCASEEYAPHPIEEPTIVQGGGRVVFITRKGSHSTTAILKEMGKISEDKPPCPYTHG